MTLPDPSVPDDPDYAPGTFTRRINHLAKTLRLETLGERIPTVLLTKRVESSLFHILWIF